MSTAQILFYFGATWTICGTSDGGKVTGLVMMALSAIAWVMT